MWRKKFAKGIFAILQTKSYYNDKKSFKKNLKKIVRNYFEGVYSKEFTVFEEVEKIFSVTELSISEQNLLQKYLLLFFLGQLLDLPTLNSILEEYGISSNKLSKKFSELQSKISTREILKLYEKVFEQQLGAHLSDLCQKHSCVFSRDLVTVVLDDSIFKQWLSSFREGEDFGGFYGKFFSGQTKSSVYGFRILCLGICVDGIFYPLYLEYVKTSTVEKGDAIKKAEKLIKRFGEFRTWFNKKFAKEVKELPKLHFSCDNGYSDKILAECCEKNDLIYISVPKKSHYFIIDSQSIKLSDWIKQVFEPLEKAHINEQNKLVEKGKQNKIQPFIYRFKGFYRSKKMNLTLIAFRLNGSKRVSIVYSTSDTIFRKTMRRHWFQRTYIEQFFKILKHVLKIQESTTKNKRDFTFKLLRFMWMGLHVQKLVRLCKKRKRKIDFRNKGFIFIQRCMRKDDVFNDLLQQLINTLN